jgi:hypothetical protein
MSTTYGLEMTGEKRWAMGSTYGGERRGEVGDEYHLWKGGIRDWYHLWRGEERRGGR